MHPGDVVAIVGGQGPRLRQIFFHIQTTGSDTDDRILQLSAVGSSQLHDFNMFADPESPISEQTTEATGLTYDGRHLYRNGTQTPCFPISIVLNDFCDFLDMNDSDRRIVLVGHDVHGSQVGRLWGAARRARLAPRFERRVAGFLDTLPLFLGLYPELPGGHCLANLVDSLLHSNKSHTTADALNDARMLKGLVYKTDPQPVLEDQCTRWDFRLVQMVPVGGLS